MTKWILGAGAAALAFAAPAMALQGKGGGHGHDGGAQHAIGKADHGQKNQAAHGQSMGERGPQTNFARSSPAHGHDRNLESRAEHHAFAKAAKGQEVRSDKHADRIARVDDRALRGDRYDDGQAFSGRGKGLIAGCPPGLAAKNNGCLPPGQARQIVGAALPSNYSARMLEGPYRDWYRDDDRYMYRMGDGYLYQVNRQSNLVDALIPFGLGNNAVYPVGYDYPQAFNYYNVPTQYRSFYPDSSDSLYRYGGNAIYQVDPQTNAVQSIVQLLAGDLAVGQPLPSTYGVYNVPLSYRDQYADSASDLYRYNDGYIYRADPKTQLITAVISALT